MNNKSLNIVIFVSYTYPFIGSGVGNVALSQAEELAKRNHAVTIVSSNVPRTETEFKKKNVQFLKINALDFLYQFHIPVPLFLFNKKVIHTIKHADVVHVHDMLYPSSFFATLVASYYKKPVVVMQHIPFITYQNHWLNTLQKIVFFFLGTYILRYSSRILYCNGEVAQWLKKYQQKLVYLPNGVNTTFFHPVTDSEIRALRKKYNFPIHIPIVLFVGRLVPKKGYDLVYKASSKNYLTVFVGTGDISYELKKNPHTRFLGGKNQEELREIYQLSDIFVLPSHSEGYPLSVQEAMASGLAIVVSDLACYQEMRLDRRLVRFIDTTVTHIKTSVHEILTDSMLMKQMKQYSLRAATQYYSWETNVDRLIEVYKEVAYA